MDWDGLDGKHLFYEHHSAVLKNDINSILNINNNIIFCEKIYFEYGHSWNDQGDKNKKF